MSKIAIITGASSGIGSATAVALAERGVNSIITFNSHEDRVREVVEAVEQKGAKAVPLRLELGDTGSFAARRRPSSNRRVAEVTMAHRSSGKLSSSARTPASTARGQFSPCASYASTVIRSAWCMPTFCAPRKASCLELYSE